MSDDRDIDPLDLECHSLRDFLNLIAGVRETHPRDGLRACEDAVLDLVGLV